MTKVSFSSQAPPKAPPLPQLIMSTLLKDLSSNAQHFEEPQALETICALLGSVNTVFTVFQRGQFIYFQFGSIKEERVIHDFIRQKYPGREDFRNFFNGLKFKHATIKQNKDRKVFLRQTLPNLIKDISTISEIGAKFEQPANPKENYPNNSYDEEGKFFVDLGNFVMYNDKIVVRDEQGAATTYELEPQMKPRKENDWTSRHIYSADKTYAVESRVFKIDDVKPNLVMNIIGSFDTCKNHPKIHKFLEVSKEFCIADKKRKRDEDVIDNIYDFKIAKLQAEIDDLNKERYAKIQKLDEPFVEIQAKVTKAKDDLQQVGRNGPWVPSDISVDCGNNDTASIEIPNGQYVS